MYGEEWEKEVLEKLSEDEQRIYREKKEHAISEGIYFNPDKRIVVGIIKGLEKNLIKHGAEYCPCRPVTGDAIADAKNICPCVFHKDELARDGICKCRLFVTKDKAKEIINKHGWGLEIKDK